MLVVAPLSKMVESGGYTNSGFGATIIDDDSLYSFADSAEDDFDIEASAGMQDLEEVVHDIVEDEFALGADGSDQSKRFSQPFTISGTMMNSLCGSMYL